MKILIMGLPGSGKTWLADQLQVRLNCAWYNADTIRNMANDWDFSQAARLKQAYRMKALADIEKSYKRIVICDFVCPLDITREIFDAAFVDGCSYYQFYFRFTLPLSTPIIATVSVITLTGSWNNYLLPLIMINDESLYSWPMGIMVFRGEYFTDWGKILAYVSLTLVPAVVFFFALQKYIVAGLTGGAVKE